MPVESLLQVQACREERSAEGERGEVNKERWLYLALHEATVETETFTSSQRLYVLVP